MNLWATAAQAAVYSIVSITVGLLWKRSIKRERERLERLITGVEAVFGLTTTTLTPKKGITMIDVAAYRKGIAAGFGVILTGLLTWAETANLEPVIGPLVPEVFRPLVGVVLGGIALTASVILTTNKPKTAPADDSTIASRAAAAPAIAVAVQDGPFWAGVKQGDASAPTSAVELLPAPEPSYQ